MKHWIIKQEKGRLLFTDWQKADIHDYCLRKENKVVFKLEPVESTRTMQQNKLYWLFIGVICQETGNDPDDMHEFFKQKLLIPEIVKVKGRNGEYEIKKYKSTTQMKKLEFGEYMDKISALTGVPIPDTEAWYQEDIY